MGETVQAPSRSISHPTIPCQRLKMSYRDGEKCLRDKMDEET